MEYKSSPASCSLFPPAHPLLPMGTPALPYPRGLCHVVGYTPHLFSFADSISAAEGATAQHQYDEDDDSKVGIVKVEEVQSHLLDHDYAAAPGDEVVKGKKKANFIMVYYILFLYVKLLSPLVVPYPFTRFIFLFPQWRQMTDFTATDRRPASHPTRGTCRPST